MAQELESLQEERTLGTKTTFHSAIKRKTSSKLNLSAFI
jgi:hypothetical protein